MIDERDLIFEEQPQVPTQVQAPSIGSQIGQSLASGGAAIARGIGAPGSVIQSLTETMKQNLPENLRIKAPLGEYAPTTENIQKGLEQVTPKGYLEPKNDIQRFVNENLEDFSGALTNAVLLGGDLGGITPSLAKNVAKSTLGGSVAKKGAEFAGLGELGQGLAKFGGSILGGNWGNRAKVQQAVDDNYDNFAKAAGQETVAANESEKLADQLMERTKGSANEANKTIFEWAESIYNKIQGGKMRAIDASNLAQDINRSLRSGEIKDKYAAKIIGKLRDSLYSDPLANLEKVNPEAFNYWNTARQDSFALNSGWEASKFFDKYITKNLERFKKLSPSTQGIFKGIFGTLGGGGVGYGLVTNPLVTSGIGAGVAVGGIGLNEMSKAARLFTQSSTSRKLFANILKDISTGSASKLIRDVNQFDKSVRHFEKQFDESDIVFE